MKCKAEVRDTLDVPLPCDASWNDLTGGGKKVRFCDRCESQVYNFDSMTQSEIRRCIGGNEGRICARIKIPSTNDSNGGTATTKNSNPQFSLQSLFAWLTSIAVFIGFACHVSQLTKSRPEAPLIDKNGSDNFWDDGLGGENFIMGEIEMSCDPPFDETGSS